MKVIDVRNNFLSKKSFKKVSDLVMSAHFPWYFIKQATWEKTEHQKDSFFCHSIKYKKEVNSTFLDEIMEPFRKKLKYKELLRAKINLNYNHGEPIESNFHSDFPEYEHKHIDYQTAIFYFNSCNGYTRFKDNDIKVESVANRLARFPGELLHKSVTQTNTNRRVVLNINFI
jgi:hypothetical protein